ncbi:glycoprotein A33 [Willisornis vidua]|uniref:Glycoprotein A33 n=1 Tax=Willisornis vidua TaxID=1566151 RepID=A0ABQ9D792_9PASS|nr:glycoprotein A33 [Willisornis vidua]
MDLLEQFQRRATKIIRKLEHFSYESEENEVMHQEVWIVLSIRETGLAVTFLVSAEALTVEAPAQQIQVARGRNATLHCNFHTNRNIVAGDFVVWRKLLSPIDAVTRYLDGGVQYGEGYENRIQFSGDVNSGDISITIKEVTMEDNGTYVCSVRLREDPPRKSVIMSLFVLVAPSKPDCSIVGTPQYGQTINLTCVSQEGSPKPKYTWQSFNVHNEPRVLEKTEEDEPAYVEFEYLPGMQQVPSQS